MGEERVSLHLSESNTTLLLSTLDWLMGQYIVWTCGSCLTLIGHHVSQSLIVDNTDEDINSHLVTEDTRVHGLISIVVVTLLQKFFPKEINNVVVFILLKSFHILELSF